ncbi:DEAD/DEAH box helicase, partial [Amphibiibacter pelophylacis]
PRGRPGSFDRRPQRGPRVDPRKEFGAGTGPSILVLAPTRELAMQVSKAAANYGGQIPGLRTATVVGGMPYPAQLQAIAGRLDLLVATPGRLIDHLDSGKLNLDRVRMIILDEADRMLDMGFIEDIERIAHSLPQERQTLMVSATFGGQVGRLADEILKPDAVHVNVAANTQGSASIEQKLMWADDHRHKLALLEHILAERDLTQAVVFTSTQRDADDLALHLAELGHAVAPLHGAMPQGKRNRTLMGLRQGQLRVLVATDVAARGIDVPGISHVVNFGLPMKAEDYVHRIGRTGRAGRTGLAITLATRRDVMMLRRIQGFTQQPFKISQITGLEPRLPVTDLRPLPGGKGGGFGRSDAPRGKGGFGGGGGGYGASKPWGKPAGGPRGSRDGFRPGAPRAEGSGWSADAPRTERPAGARPWEQRPGSDRPARPWEGRPEGRPHEGRPYEARAHEARAFEGRPAHRPAQPGAGAGQYNANGVPVGGKGPRGAFRPGGKGPKTGHGPR